MAELLKAYPKGISLVVEFSLAELEDLLDFISRSNVDFNGETEPDFKKKVDSSLLLIKSLDGMCETVRNFHGA